MKISVEELTESNIRVSIGCGCSFANSVRRILLGEVQGTAIDFVEIRENRSVLADEILGNRLGLIPISCTRRLVSKNECDCDSYCEHCASKLHLRVRNTTGSVLPVTGKDVVSDGLGVTCFGSLIVKLAPGQSLDVDCVARRDSPQSHAKYSPVTAVTFDVVHKDPLSSDPAAGRKEWMGCSAVRMDIEVVEGGMKPEEVLLSALEIFKEKLIRVLEGIK